MKKESEILFLRLPANDQLDTSDGPNKAPEIVILMYLGGVMQKKSTQTHCPGFPICPTTDAILTTRPEWFLTACFYYEYVQS